MSISRNIADGLRIIETRLTSDNREALLLRQEEREAFGRTWPAQEYWAIEQPSGDVIFRDEFDDDPHPNLKEMA